MVIVKIISGPRASQQNLRPMQPRDLTELALRGWRWEVLWNTVSDHNVFEWAQQDMANKIISALVRGALIEFLDQTWMTTSEEEIEVLVAEIEDAIGYSGYNVFVSADEEERLTIGVHSQEHPTQWGWWTQREPFGFALHYEIRRVGYLYTLYMRYSLPTFVIS